MVALEHGTRRMYRQEHCRCDECRAWNTESHRAYETRVRQRDGLSLTQKYRPGETRRTPAQCSKCAKPILASVAEPLCALCRGNRPGYNIKIAPAARRAVYERDGWTCQICAEPVDPDAPANSTWDATLDHIVPRSLGGSDDPGNLRLAHRWCNSVRGDLRFHNDADLRIA